MKEKSKGAELEIHNYFKKTKKLKVKNHQKFNN